MLVEFTLPSVILSEVEGSEPALSIPEGRSDFLPMRQCYVERHVDPIFIS
jgi:hypothetical protein